MVLHLDRTMDMGARQVRQVRRHLGLDILRLLGQAMVFQRRLVEGMMMVRDMSSGSSFELGLRLSGRKRTTSASSGVEQALHLALVTKIELDSALHIVARSALCRIISELSI